MPINLPKILNDFLRRLLPPKNSSVSGSIRPINSAFGINRRKYDLEIEDNPVRDAHKAREYIELIEHCYEVRHSLKRATDDTFASSDGDDQGFTISDTLEDNETSVNSEVLAIALDVIQRKENHENFVIGGDKLKRALHLSLGYGDSFLEIGIEREGISSNDWAVSKSIYLPTWEIFRKENDQGYLEGFEQRKYLSNHDPDYFFYPPQIVHFRNDVKFLYGESLWKQSLENWANLKQAVANLAEAANDLGINPNIHTLPEGYDEQARESYIESFYLRQAEGIVTNLFTLPGGDIKKLYTGTPSLVALIDNLLQCRYRMLIPGFPTYIFPGLQAAAGTKELSRSPDRIYARMRYNWCQLLSKGIRQVIDTEIILKKGWDWYVDNAQNKYRIIWPTWSIDGLNEEEVDATGVNDLEKEENNNGNGKGKSRQLYLK